MPGDNIGVVHFFPLVVATGGICFGTSAMINCRAVEIPDEIGGVDIDAGVFAYRTKGFIDTVDGVWAVDVCRPYTDIRDDFGFDYEEDGWMQTLERIALTIPILGGIALICNCISVCSGVPSILWKGFGLIYVTCAILQGVGLKIMDSYICTNNPIVQYAESLTNGEGNRWADECVFGLGMRLGISATVFWAVAGIACLATVPPQKDDDMPDDLPELEVETKEDPVDE